ncbi:hypothetical protein DOTSEDRAFT_69571 [Dothistroma septosporum NZE10]|uniref:Uncharacterized protein n=1 Tax=Dothistroma septosporum (strain NZE10 / CBS 128990) TaxID=675120 RepID=N1PXF4_DOTSN|nr:hypothetical protein DOTSEDRAFT_69571 [Dothistroma septosporum NZE10]
MSHLLDSSSRMRDGDGHPYPTECSERIFASRPYDHVLICGHGIQTSEKERCGSNCALPATAERKIKNSAFACPVPHYAQDRRRLTKHNKVFLPKPGQIRLRFRRRELFGAEDSQGTNSERKYRNRAGSHQPRKRSRSPIRARPAQATVQREDESMDPAEVLNALVASDEAYKALLALTGPGVRPKKDGRFKTLQDFEFEFKEKAVAQALNNLCVLDTDKLRHRLVEAKGQHLAANPDFGRSDKEFGEELGKANLENRMGAGIDTGLDCSVCGERAEDIAFKCVHCLEFVFCNTCVILRREQHPRDEYHRFDVINPRPCVDCVADDEQGGFDKAAEVPHEPASFCKCETTSKQYLVLCAGEECKSLFHPGCFGRGLSEDNMYDQENGTYYLRKDYNAAKTGRKFKCEACHDDTPIQSETSRQRSARIIGRAKDRSATQGKATKEVYNSQKDAAKNAELKMAKTEEEKVDIEAKWEEIADDEMDVDHNEHAGGYPTYRMGPITFLVKSQ